MKSNLKGGFNPLAPEPKVADTATVRKFVRDMSEISDKIKEARQDYNEAIKTNDEIISIDEQIKKLKEERKEVILNNTVIQGFKDVLNDTVEERRQIISDAKDDGVPRKEIDLAIKALKTDVDMAVSTEVYTSIADLIE